MASKREPSPSLRMRKIALVICEGETEVCYLNFIDDRNNFRWKDVLSTGLRVFIAGIDGATGIAQVAGGGGTSNDMPWRDKDEDFLDWARRAMRYAHAKHYPGNRLKRSLSK